MTTLHPILIKVRNSELAQITLLLSLGIAIIFWLVLFNLPNKPVCMFWGLIRNRDLHTLGRSITKIQGEMEVSKMDINTFIVTVFTHIDDWLKGQNMRLRQRGPQPTLDDNEVLNIEVAIAFLGISTDKGVFLHFRRHYSDYFPALGRIHRTTYVRQSANLWQVKAHLWQALVRHIPFDPAFSIVDSMPVPVCRFARANRCRRLRDISAYGPDEVDRQTFLGVRAHLRICWPGVIVGLAIAPANVHEMPVAEDLLAKASGWVLADPNYWSPHLKQRLSEHDLHLLAPFRKAKHEPKPWPT